VSILYCAIPHFAVALAQRERPELEGRTLVLIGLGDRVLDASAQAATCGVVPGLTARLAQIRCPQAHLIEADVDKASQAFEALLGVLEQIGNKVEPHGWGAAYVDLDDLARNRADAVAICSKAGKTIRRELGTQLEPALGWNRSKFTAQSAARRTRPGRLLAIPTAQERTFLAPLYVGLLPLEQEPLRRLRFLGLRTLGQYATLPQGAVWQQFGRAGVLAQRCAQGRDDRPVISRRETPYLAARHEYEFPLVDQARLKNALRRLTSPLLTKLREDLRACSLVRLTMRFDNGHTSVRTRAFVVPTSSTSRLSSALEQLATQDSWPTPVIELEVALEEIQDAAGQMEQLSFLPGEDGRADKLRQVQRYLATRFGAHCLRRAILAQPNAPLAEWRVGWSEADHTPRINASE
jgi:protein ImuB